LAAKIQDDGRKNLLKKEILLLHFLASGLFYRGYISVAGESGNVSLSGVELIHMSFRTGGEP
jgi:hypothetical protein